MPLITETYYLSLTQDNRGILRLRCSQDDTLRTVNLKLYNNGSIFVIPSGVSASISGVRQNGTVFSKPCTISQDRQSVVLQLSSDITNVDGIIVAEIVLNDGEGGRLGTSNFIIQVEKNPIRAGVVQDTETPIEYINDFIEKIQTLTARLNNLITPSGDPSLAEVVDARIGILDSTTYQTLGARLNAEFQRLSNALNGVTILESTGDTTDRTSEILSKLNAYGACKLGKGDFYVNNLVMPENTQLIGSGKSTRAILPSAVTSGCIVKPRSNCIIENISFYGGFTGTYSELIASGANAQRHCIRLNAFDGVSSENVILNNIYINSFVGSAIIQGSAVGCHCEDIVIDMCYAGIDISNVSYDGQCTNVSMKNTRFGIVQNGSNFIFTNCVSKDSAYHIMGDQQNTGCTFSSCSFSESSLKTTSKLASISNAREGITFDNCIFDSSLSMLLNACDGIVIKGTNFVGSDTFAITVSNGRNTLLLITDCIADVEPVVTNAGTAARITSCYLKDGIAWNISEADIIVDEELSDESENPIQNKAVASAISEINESLGNVQADLGAQANGKLGITLVEGKYVNPSSGQYISRTGAYAIDYVDCIPSDTVLIVSASASAYGAFYNASKERVASLILIAGNNYIKIPDTAYFFATSTLDSSVSSIQIYSKIGTDTKNLVEKVEYFGDTKALAIGTKTVVTGNLYSASDATQGYYLSGTAGTPTANENYAYTGYIPLDGDSYAYSSNVASAGIYFYDEDYNLLSPLARVVQNYTSADTWPMGTKYCRFNLNVSIINAITFTTSKNTGYYISEAQIVKNEYNINVGSTRTYTTLKSAVDYINSIGDDKATYNILLDAGTYNALDGYDLSTQASTFMGLVLPDNTNIIGQSSPANVIIAVDGTNFPDNINKNEISVINLYRNNIIKNVTVKSKNIRYGLHDDDSYRGTGAVSDAVQIFENVHFINEARTVTGTASYCAGIGAKKGQTLTFKNCIFENQDTTYCAIGVHNGTTAEKPVTYNFQNCKFACNGSYGLRLTTTAYNILDNVNLYGCKSNKNVMLDRANSNENTNTGFKFFGYGNTGLTLSVNGIVLNESDTEMML